MIDQQRFADIGSLDELRECRRTIAESVAQSRTRLDHRRQQLTTRLTPTSILGYVATRTESVLAIFSVARRIYSLAQKTFARMKKG